MSKQIRWDKNEVIAAHYLHLAGYSYREIAHSFNELRPSVQYGVKRTRGVTLNKIKCQVLAYRKVLG
jgi:hypothetical protein